MNKMWAYHKLWLETVAGYAFLNFQLEQQVATAMTSFFQINGVIETTDQSVDEENITITSLVPWSLTTPNSYRLLF